MADSEKWIFLFGSIVEGFEIRNGHPGVKNDLGLFLRPI